MLASLLLLASSALAMAPHLENAVTIHTSARDYLEFDIAGVSPCRNPMVYGLSLVGAKTATVHWTFPGIVVDTICAEKTTRANVIVPFPDSVGGSHGAVVLDTLRSNGNELVTTIGRVQNPALPTMCPMVKCIMEDSTAALQKVLDRIKSATFVATFAPYYVESFVAISPWSKTTGQENLPEVTAPLAGNVGNWIDVETVRLSMDSLIAGSYSNPCLPHAGIACPDLLVLPMVTLPTGPVQYVYQQAADPFKGDSIGTGNPFVIDTVVKIGSRLHLSGYVNRSCGHPLVDSQLIQATRWLVASNSDNVDSLISTFHSPSNLCSNSRLGAWPISGGKVEITNGIWVSLKFLQGPTGLLPRAPRSVDASIHRVGQAASLNLTASSYVRAVDISGRELLPLTAFAPGKHSLTLPSRGMLFVQVRSGLSTTTLPLQPAP